MFLRMPSAVRVFWQTALSILIGLSVGFILLAYTGRLHAQALPNSLISEHLTMPGPPAWMFWPKLNQHLNILVMGVDSNGDNCKRFLNTRSDTIMVVSFNPDIKKVGVLSIPRDTRVKIAGAGINKINAAHAFGGPQLAITTIGENFGIPIDRYLIVDAQGLRDLCQELGPVEVLVEKDMHYEDHSGHLHVDLKPGLQTLDSTQMEGYVRFRHDARGDIGRIERQQWFLRQLANKLQDPSILLKAPQLFNIANQYVQTNLSVEEMAQVASFLKDLNSSQFETATLPGTPQLIDGCSYWLADTAASQIVINRLLNTNIVEQESDTATKPFTIAIRYPTDKETAARVYESSLQAAGFKVRYLWPTEAQECQHEQIIQSSSRADDITISQIRKLTPQLANCPVVMSIESRPVVDVVLVLSPSLCLSTTSTPANLANQSTPTTTHGRI